MRVEAGDYVYYNDIVGGSTALAKVTSVKDDVCKGFVADESAATKSTRQECEFSVEYVKFNLGKNPITNVAGKAIDIFRQTTDLKGWGSIIWMTKPREEDIEAVHTTFNKLRIRCAKRNLHPFAHETHIGYLAPSAKVLGMYYYRPKTIDVLLCRMNDGTGMPLHIPAHEYAHGLWWRVMTDMDRARWIKAYHKSVTCDVVSDNQVKSVLRDLADVKSRAEFNKVVSDARKEDIDIKGIMTSVFKAIASHHKLQRRDLMALLDSGEHIATYLPSAIDVARAAANTAVSDYANKAAGELWAESFALTITGKELPENIEKLMAKTLVHLQASR